MVNEIEVVNFSTCQARQRVGFPVTARMKAGQVCRFGSVEKSTNLMRSDLGGSSGDDFLDRLTVVDIQSLAAGDFQPARIESKLLQDGGVNVRNIVTVFDRMEANLVGGAMYHAALQTATSHPDAEAEDVMIAPIGTL